MPKTDLLFFQGKLKNFEGFSRAIEDVNGSTHVTKRRLSNSDLITVLGQEELPIISSDSELARCIVSSAHEQGGQKIVSDTIAKPRFIAYVDRAEKLVRSAFES